ncbi:hypothetical protein [Enterococcus italicus]|uniref:hypothetical protein n=1 Tax=Enterococcus italicus TaxID=246144 RepID=UPI0028B1231D|nr:hypothetical protein [Enterococcus italicus]
MKKNIVNRFLIIGVINFICAFSLIWMENVSFVLKIAGFLFFMNFVLNMNLATKYSKGEL